MPALPASAPTGAFPRAALIRLPEPRLRDRKGIVLGRVLDGSHCRMRPFLGGLSHGDHDDPGVARPFLVAVVLGVGRVPAEARRVG